MSVLAATALRSSRALSLLRGIRTPSALRVPGAAGAFGREAGLAAVTAFVYFLIRGAVVDRVAEAGARAEGLYALERRLGLDWEAAMQSWILGSRFLIDLVNGIYFWTHMPLIVVVALALYWKRRQTYRLIRNAFLVSAAIGLALYFALPLAPPRLLPELGFVDTMAIYARANYQAQEVGPFVNPYAAMPSLHFGWALLIGIGLWQARPAGRPLRLALALAAVAIVVGQLFAVVMTGNHWLLDVVAGGVVALTGLAVAKRWQGRLPGRPRRYRAPGPAR